MRSGRHLTAFTAASLAMMCVPQDAEPVKVTPAQDPTPNIPVEPPESFRRAYGEQAVKRARKQRWLEGHPINQDDADALQAAAERRIRRSQKKQKT